MLDCTESDGQKKSTWIIQIQHVLEIMIVVTNNDNNKRDTGLHRRRLVFNIHFQSSFLLLGEKISVKWKAIYGLWHKRHAFMKIENFYNRSIQAIRQR